MKNPIYRSVVELRAALGAGEITATRIVDAHLEQIFVHNRAINALVTVDETGARESARESDEARARGEDPGPLHGIPFTVKDMFETKGLRTTNGHKPLANNIPERDATVVARLREAGGTLLAKSNMPAQGMDIQCENALFGATKNPWDLSRTPGGSTGGEAAALAAGMTPLGIGSDIGGSLRIPAHYCGVFACKPTEGLVPRTGLLLPGTVNTVRHMVACGPMARSVADLRLALRIMAGPDGVDPSVVPVPLKEFPLRPLKDHRFAWTDDFGGLPVTASTREAMEKLASDLRDAGCQVHRVVPEDFEFPTVWKTYGELFTMMALAELPAPLRTLIRILGPLMFKDPITRAGARVASAGLKRYFMILEQRDALVAALERFFGDYDAWITPVTPAPAFLHRKMGKIHTPIDVDGRKIPGNIGGIGYTCPFNLTGHPAVLMPLTLTREGLPLGVQLVGPLWGDMDLLNAAEALSQITPAFTPPPMK